MLFLLAIPRNPVKYDPIAHPGNAPHFSRQADFPENNRLFGRAIGENSRNFARCDKLLRHLDHRLDLWNLVREDG